MQATKAATLPFLLCAVFVAGCNSHELPPVNAKNCELARIKEMQATENERREFGTRCAHSGSFQSTPSKTY